MAYDFQHSVEVSVSREAAWRFWTNVSNWLIDAGIASVTLDGPFQPGGKGTTKTKDAQLVQWQIVEVTEGQSAVIEIPMPGATLRFAWKFEELSESLARLTQQITLVGDQADTYVAQLGDKFEENIQAGMKKLSQEIERANAGSFGSGRVS